ncbi:MAG: hypothetical protein ABIH23_20040, partial [bacterium]
TLMRNLHCKYAILFVLFCLGCASGAIAAAEASSSPDSIDWESHFRYQYDYTLQETVGLQRDAAPVEVTLSAKAGEVADWEKDVRVIRVGAHGEKELVPVQVYGQAKAQTPSSENPPTESANIVFIASCPASKSVTYRLLWCRTDSLALPKAYPKNPLHVTGKIPGITVESQHYSIALSEKCGAIIKARRAQQDDEKAIDFFQNIPIHFVADVWSPPESWDHDYDWATPPNQEIIQGPLMVKYHRWGPMSRYKDVMAYLTYTFYADVPYVHVASMMEFTENRSTRAVRLGEVVTTHLETKEHRRDRKEELVPVFTHYAWPEGDRVTVCDIAKNLNSENVAVVEGYVEGALAILDRDVPWVAAYHEKDKYGMASLRKSHVAMNKLGGPLPFTAPSTYLGQYGWGFTYWSRPEVYPFGPHGTDLDRNTVVAEGTIFANEEALLVFDPSRRLEEVRNAYQAFTEPLRLQFKGTGPW